MQVQANRSDQYPDDRRSVSEQANRALCELNNILDRDGSPEISVRVESIEGVVQVPREVAEVMRQVLASTAAGQSVAVIPHHAELTTQQAADMLGVSRPYLIKQLSEGRIAYRKVGSHRRINAASLEQYRKDMAHEGRKAADELTALAEDMGLYE